MGQYRVVRKLASGGMADVFLGKVVGAGGFEKPVAIKRMLPCIAGDPTSAEAFLREARLCVHLVHPHVVQVFDLGTSGGSPYLVMELVDGPDLRRVLVAAKKAGKPITVPEAVYISACVAEALGYAYEARGPGGVPLRVVHRDVNPANVLLSMHGAVKLADFGVAKAADGREATQGNLVKGKLGYIAPELLSGTPAGHASDIFLVGALLYELTTGRQLFPGSGPPPEVLGRIVAHDERKVSLPVGTAPELLPILQKALARKPEARFGHARELASALREVIAKRGWKIGAEEIAARLAGLFPNRVPLDHDLGPGVALRDDPKAPSSGQACDRPAKKPEAEAPSPAGKSVAARSVAQSAPAAQAGAGRAETARSSGRKRLGEMLIEAGLITEGQLQHLLSRQRHEGGRLGEWAVQLDYAPARAVLGLLSKQLKAPFITDEKILEASPPEALLERFPQELALRLLALPLSEKQGTVFVAMTDPADLGKVDMVRFQIGKKVQPVVCTEFGLRRAISRFYGGRAEDHKWRQLDPSDPLALLTSRMVDFDESGRVRAASGGGKEAAGATPVPAAATVPAITPVPGYPTYALPAPGSATPTFTPPQGSAFAYVVAGVGPDGRPVLMPVPLSAPVTPSALAPAADPAAARSGEKPKGGTERG
ncbi:MAG: protein kinase domain-containing protein [Myxococcales bacterium]